jgi:alkylation response protein AidB-like acyl-CoA dehydrogenase
LAAELMDPVDRARLLAVVAAEHADAGEQHRRLARPVVEAFAASGLGRLLAPTALGGMAAHPGRLIEVVETVATADPSAGWCVGIGIGANYMAGFLPEAGARELFVDLDRPGSGTFAPVGRGVSTPAGYRVSGRWAFGSGCQHTAVHACGMFTMGPDGNLESDAEGVPIPRLALVVGDMLRIDETWDTVGLRGTGSHDVELADTMVPREHTLRSTDQPWPDDVLYRMPLFTVLGPALGAVPLGVGRAALDVVEARIQAAHASPRPGAKAAFGDDALSQAELGRAEIRLRAARSFLLDTADAGYRTGAAGDPVPRSHTALVGLACQEAMAASIHAVDVACRIGGSSSVRADSPLERLQRDINTMRQHAMFSPALAAPLGRQLAGIPTVAWPFLPKAA